MGSVPPSPLNLAGLVVVAEAMSSDIASKEGCYSWDAKNQSQCGKETESSHGVFCRKVFHSTPKLRTQMTAKIPPGNECRSILDDSGPSRCLTTTKWETLRINCLAEPSQWLKLWKVATKWLLVWATEFWEWSLHWQWVLKQSFCSCCFSVCIAFTFLFPMHLLYISRYQRSLCNCIPKPLHDARSCCFVMCNLKPIPFF